jgi:hypothetical protein
MKNFLFIPFVLALFACDSSTITPVADLQPVDASEFRLSLDPEVDQLAIDFANACPFNAYTCKLANRSNHVYREVSSGQPVAVNTLGNPEGMRRDWVATWCAKTSPSKVHIDFVRYPEGQDEQRVWACVMDDYSPGAVAGSAGSR